MAQTPTAPISKSAEATIAVRVNERAQSIASGTTPAQLRAAVKPQADVVIRNGYPLSGAALDEPLRSGDEIVFIRRGEVPSVEEMETLMTARHGPGVHAKVRGACVGIAGCGGLGSALAVALARTGVGALRLVDYDVVEPSNLNRQQYFVDQIGRFKVEALAENLARVNPAVRADGRILRLASENISKTFAGCDIIAECFDDPAAKRDLLVTVRRGLPATPLVTVSGIAGTGPAGELRVRRVMERVFLIGDGESEARQGQGLLAPRVAVAAGLQASVILRWLLGEISESDTE